MMKYDGEEASRYRVVDRRGAGKQEGSEWL
jgi:hypothetical protein